MKKVLGLGNALTDMLLQVSEGDLRELGYPKGSMNLITKQEAAAIQQRFASVRKRLVAGGSACNAISTIASLGGKAAFIGKIGKDGSRAYTKEELDAMLRFANAAAAIVTTRRGALRVMPSLTEIETVLA